MDIRAKETVIHKRASRDLIERDEPEQSVVRLEDNCPENEVPPYGFAPR